MTLPISVIAPPKPATYIEAVLQDHPTLFLPLNEQSGNIAYDLSGNGNNGNGNNGTYSGSFTLGQPGPSAGNGAVDFAAGGYIATTYVPQNAAGFTMESYFMAPQSIAGLYAVQAGNLNVEFPYGFLIGEFYHVIVTLDAEVWTAYVNGSELTSATIDYPYLPGTGPVAFGQAFGLGSEEMLWGGLAFYDGVALSAQRVAAHYAALI